VTDCAAPRHADGDRPETRPSSYLCYPCEHGLRRDLRRLPAHHADLEELLVTIRSGAFRGPGDGLIVNQSISDVQALMRRNVTRCVLLIAETRGFALPPDRFPAMCGWLVPMVGWASFQDWAPAMAGAFRTTVNRARSLLDQYVTRRIELHAACVEPDCHGQLWASVYDDDDRRRPAIECDACGTGWTAEQWLHLGQRIIKREEAMAS
jgi:hypothetical protein